MGDFDPVFIETLKTQSWPLYSVGMFLILMRMYARIHRLGFKDLQTDDYLMVLVAGLYTTLMVTLNVIAQGGGSNLYPPEDFVTFSLHDIQDRIKGSKIVIVSEQAMLCVIYTIKACMLIMYTRLTRLTRNRLVLYVSIYVGIGFAATEIAFFANCRPFAGYWAMPPPQDQCATYTHYSIVQGCFNITSDILMLCIPLPLVTKLAMPWKQKAFLFVIFSMGLFIILAAILNKIFNLSNPWDPLYMLWYTRESSVAVYVSNLPMIWPLMREFFPVLRSLTPGQKALGSPSNKSGPTSSRRTTRTVAGRNVSNGFETKISTTTQGTRDGDSTEELRTDGMTEMGVITSQESWDFGAAKQIQDPSKGYEARTWDSEQRKGGIYKSTTIRVLEEHIDESELETEYSSLRNQANVYDIEKGKA